jgi:predicted SprT family Zn-dependent metalloprotease
MREIKAYQCGACDRLFLESKKINQCHICEDDICVECANPINFDNVVCNGCEDGEDD